MVPDGCERGPWQPGLELFPCAYLQRHANDWSHVALHLLPPGATFYRAAEHPFIVNERCCAPGAEKPRLNRGGPLHHDVARLEALSVTDANDKRMRLLGVLLREWNAHPEGSAVLGTTLAFDEDFAVLDLPPDP